MPWNGSIEIPTENQSPDFREQLCKQICLFLSNVIWFTIKFSIVHFQSDDFFCVDKKLKMPFYTFECKATIQRECQWGEYICNICSLL